MKKTLSPAAPAAALIATLAATLAGAWPARAQDKPAPSPTPTASTEIVVSATKLPEDPVDIAGPVEVVTGDQIRRTVTSTLADAIQNVVGVDTGNGSDSGAHLPNIGMWGLKEFDALLITVDGVPVGGPFNPSLSQIPVEDIDRIEIVKGPQGTLYGVSAFGGMIQVFTRRKDTPSASVTLGGGSFSEKRAAASYSADLGSDFSLRAYGSLTRSLGWQDRTDYSSDRLTLSGEKRWGATTLGVSLITYRDTNYWGTPQPSDGGAPVPGFENPDRNYAVDGARLDHRVSSLSSSFSTPLGAGLKLENTLGLTRDEQISVRTFVHEFEEGSAAAEGVAIKPVETSFFDDVRAVAEFEGAGRHRLVGGAAITWGRTTASGNGFDIEVTTGPNPIVPRLSDVPAGDNRSFTDRRTFFGLYLNDEWTPIPRLTLTFGGRYDNASETLSVRQQEVGDPNVDAVDDHRTDGKFSGGVSALVRGLEAPVGPLDAANVYASFKSNFKPAAPNLSEAESARILDPERARSGEFGLKTRWMNRQIGFDVTYFHMIFENLVVAVPSPTGEPALTNAGEERFQGWEFDGSYQPSALPGLSLSAGYAHHDARFVHFSFFTPDGDLRIVDGKQLELAPRDLWNLRIAYAPKSGPGAFVAVRHQNRRPLNRRNTFYTGAFEEVDAGLSYDISWGRVAVVGRNLGDSRHYTTESEIGDSQFYVAPPRRVSAEVTFRF